MAIEPIGDSFNYNQAGAKRTAELVGTVPTQFDASGSIFRPDAMPQTLNYSGDSLASISVTDGTSTWVQSFSYTNGKLTGISAWVKQ